MVKNGLVDVVEFRSLIAAWKCLDSRGFPLGGARSPQFWKNQPRCFRLPLVRRLEIIRRQIDAMSDQDQLEFLSVGPAAWIRMFRPNVQEAFFEIEKAKSSAVSSSPA
jgi:hypothetical protein